MVIAPNLNVFSMFIQYDSIPYVRGPANFHTLIHRAFIEQTQMIYDKNHSLKQVV